MISSNLKQKYAQINLKYEKLFKNSKKYLLINELLFAIILLVLLIIVDI